MLKSLLLVLGLACAVAANAAPGRQRPAETLRVGDPAPDFALASPAADRTVRLADYRGVKPVVLIFGSYTCPPFRDVYPTLERLYKDFGDAVAFFYIYIREAHPEDGWKIPRNQREGITITDPKSLPERAAIAKEACSYFKTAIPALVDTMDDATDRAYAAWPSRIYLVDATGHIAVRGDAGPRGLVPAARAVEEWLQQHARPTTPAAAK